MACNSMLPHAVNILNKFRILIERRIKLFTDSVTPAAAEKNGPQRFEGGGVNFKAKLIGCEDVSQANGDQMCQEMIQSLKTSAKSTSGHKQPITVNVSLAGIKILEGKTAVRGGQGEWMGGEGREGEGNGHKQPITVNVSLAGIKILEGKTAVRGGQGEWMGGEGREGEGNGHKQPITVNVSLAGIKILEGKTAVREGEGEGKGGEDSGDGGGGEGGGEEGRKITVGQGLGYMTCNTLTVSCYRRCNARMPCYSTCYTLTLSCYRRCYTRMPSSGSRSSRETSPTSAPSATSTDPATANTCSLESRRKKR